MKGIPTFVLLLLVAVGLAVAVAVRASRPMDRRDLPVRDAAVSIDINSAGAADLSLLPGVGPAIAERIIEDRREHGAYESVAQLQRVRGIGPRTMERIVPFVRCTPPVTPAAASD